MLKLNCLLYNVMLPVQEPVKRYGQSVRANMIHKAIQALETKFDITLDVVVLLEVIPSQTNFTITKNMHSIGFVNVSNTLEQPPFAQSGILIFSRHQLTQNEAVVFQLSECSGLDCLCTKGCVYVRIKIGETYINLFACHLQAWNTPAAVKARRKQILKMARFIKSVKIPSHEPLIVCGDFNVDLYTQVNDMNFLLHTLNAGLVQHHKDSTMFTNDARENKLTGSDDISSYFNSRFPSGCYDYYSASGGECKCCSSEWLDHFLTIKNFQLPEKAAQQIIPLKTDAFKIQLQHIGEIFLQDVSDHFPVLFQGEYTLPDATIRAKPTCELQTTFPHKEWQTWTTNGFWIVFVLCCMYLLGRCVWKY